METIFVFAATALVAAATAAVWRAWRAEAAREVEARLRAAAEERARQEAEAREAEARLRAAAEERARQEAEAREAEARLRAAAEEKARKEAERAQREAERAKREAERAQREAEARKAAERRCAKLGADIADSRVNIVKRITERELVNALTRAIPALAPERGRRIQNQIESLARLRADSERIRKEMAETSDKEAAAQLQKRMTKAAADAEALVARLRNILENDPELHGIKLSLAWGSRVSVAADKNKKAEEKKAEEKEK
jgi:hypothetical protein